MPLITQRQMREQHNNKWRERKRGERDKEFATTKRTQPPLSHLIVFFSPFFNGSVLTCPTRVPLPHHPLHLSSHEEREREIRKEKCALLRPMVGSRRQKENTSRSKHSDVKFGVLRLWWRWLWSYKLVNNGEVINRRVVGVHDDFHGAYQPT